MKAASRELLASREDVWAFLAEPYHLSDWWPGLVGVDPDRRGFAAGARWQVSLHEEPIGPRLGTWRSSGSLVSATVLVTEVATLEEWSWSLIRRSRSLKTARTIDVTVRLQTVEPERTQVTVSVSGKDLGSWSLLRSRDEWTARVAVNRLYDLVQTAGTL